MIPTHQEPLWNRIRQFDLDDPTATVKFSDKLASENNWSSSFTSRVIEEYKRFMFLCTISPTGASPSKIVDEAWHLHLTYTHNYWKVFCKDVLEKEIHHIPSKGGDEQDEYHYDWYGQTLSRYQIVFDEAPPIDIWPPSVVRKTESVYLQQEDDHSKPAYLKQAWILLLPLLVPVFYNKSHPFQLAGPQYLIFYFYVIASSLVFLYLIYRYNKQVVTEILSKYYDPKASIYQVTRFMFGRERSVQTAILDLVDRKILEAEKDRSFTFLPGAIRYSGEEKNPLVHNILKAREENDRIPYRQMAGFYDSTMTEHGKLAELNNQLSIKDSWKFLALIFPVIFSFPRLLQAYQNHRPALFLILFMVISGVAFLAVYTLISKGNIANRLMTRNYQEHHVSTGFSRNQFNDFAFLGVSALGYTYMYTVLADTFQNRKVYGDSGSYGGGCGSSGGGCGSSCGGGCGGCGGGD